MTVGAIAIRGYIYRLYKWLFWVAPETKTGKALN